MKLGSIIDALLKYVPSIKKPSEPLSFRQKLKWTAAIMVIYFFMFSTPAFGVSVSTISQPFIQILNVIFAARMGSLITVGISPIVLSSIVLQLIMGAGILKVDLNDPEQKGRFQGIQKLSAITIAIIEGYLFAHGVVPGVQPSFVNFVALQFMVGAVFIIFMDEAMTKFGITSGINLFIAGGVAYSIVAGTSTILLNEAVQAIAAGGATAIPNAILVFGPLFFSTLVLLVSIYVYDIKVEIPLVFSQLRGVGGRLPIPFLYVSVLPVILATSLESSLALWLRPLAGVSGQWANLVKFFALYQTQAATAGSQLQLTGGLIYLISPTFPSVYSATYGGIGGYGPYFSFLFSTGVSQLYLPWGGAVAIPEVVHVIVYILALAALSVVFDKFWIEMTGQSPKHVAEQLQDVGWQVPGFRRDPRIVESILNKYIPTITVLGSIFVGLLAALATLTGAVGTGMGILLTVGIMYMVYQQLQQEHAFETYPELNKLLS